MDNLKFINNDADNGFVNLKRKSHFQLDEPSVTVRENQIYLSASTISTLKLREYKSCYVSLRNCNNPKEADKIFLRPNNNADSEDNCRIALDNIHGRNTAGATLCGLTTIYKQVDRLRVLLTKDRKQRRIFLKKCEDTGFWYMPLIPNFEYTMTNFENVKNDKVIYRLVLRNRIQNIGETVHLGKRLKEKETEQIPFDTVEYSLMNNADDNTRKYWESYHIEKHKKEYGDLPPYNRQNGRRLDH